MGGHGTHTAGTAGGNYGVQTPYTPSDALLSGMAPRARLAIYKVGGAWQSEWWHHQRHFWATGVVMQSLSQH